MQRYVSSELTHFVGAKLATQEEQYRLLIRILKEGRLGAGEKYYGGNYWYGPRMDTTLASNEFIEISSMVCFCDIPPQDLAIHMSKYSRFGLAFNKRALVSKGVRPVYYVPLDEDDSHPYSNFKYIKSLEEVLQELSGMTLDDPILKDHKASERLLMVSHYVREMEANIFGYMKFFDINTTDTDQENYYMEREWRVNGQIQFSLSEVCRIVLPEEYSTKIRADLPEYTSQIQFS